MHIVLVGCGEIARAGYLPALGHLQPERVTLVDPDAVAGQDACTHLRDLGVDAAWLPTAADLGLPAEAGIVAVPPRDLPEVVNALLRAPQRPQSLLIEKPLGPDHETAIRLVRDAGAVMSLAYMETFLHSTAYDVLLDELASGRLGRATRAKIAVRGSTPAHLDTAWRGDRSAGGGVLHDWGVHSLGFALHLGRTEDAPHPVEVEVLEASWREFGTRRILTSCRLVLSGMSTETTVTTAWDGDLTTAAAPDVVVECEHGKLALLVRKTAGSSDWVCLEYTDSGVRELASRRYPKELFVRGVDGFLRLANGGACSSAKYDVSLGVEALRLADAAYNQALRM